MNTTTQTVTATWTKLRDGSWGVRVAGPARAGERLTVTKRDGSSSLVTLGEVAWTDGAVSLCRVAADLTARTPRGARRTTAARTRGTWTGCSCGSVEEYARESDCRSCRHDR